MHSKLEQLKGMTTVVADTGDIEAIKRLHPVDATTNPTLLLKAAALKAYQPMLKQAAKESAGDKALACERFAVAIGREILSIIPGRISTEVDARLSFDRALTLVRAKLLISLYEDAGIARDRVLIKIAATWEGIQAAQALEQEGIQTNLTLLFSFAQALACAQAKVFLISPFVGRIYDWYKKAYNRDYDASEDPGVQSVTRIYHYYKQHGYQTIVMGASFRNLGEVERLAGCDRLTISPDLMEKLAQAQGKLPRMLSTDAPWTEEPLQTLDEPHFRWAMNEDAMATEKLAEGIRNFAKDQCALEQLMQP